MRDPLADFANSLTPEQACRLYDIAAPLTPAEKTKFDTMSDDDLLRELGVASEPTAAGDQLLIPGCERRQTHGTKPPQPDLWDAANKAGR